MSVASPVGGLGRPTDPSARNVARIVGALFLITFVTSIGALILYGPVLHPVRFIGGDGSDGRVRLGAVLELILIVANVGTAVFLFPILKREHEGLALGFVGARLVESIFIAVGIVSILAAVTLRHQAGGSGTGSLVTTVKALVTIRDWTFILGPGFIVGIGNGMILGYLMYRSQLVPRGMAMLGLVGGPLICLTGIAVVLDIIGKGSAVQGIATIPEFFWELSLGVYLLVKGFKSAPILDAARHTGTEQGSLTPAGATP
jgi:Domain of unknown function (DUF4386)